MPKTKQLTAKALNEKLSASVEFMERLTEGFDERNERLLYRKSGNAKGSARDILDNTLSSYLEKIPKNVVQKLPTFKLTSNGDEAQDLVLEFIASDIIMKSGNNGYNLLQKQWIVLRNALTFGMSAVYLPFMFSEGKYTVGFEPIYWGDLFIEPYASNINSANWVFFRNIMTKDDIQAIIDEVDEDIDDMWDRNKLQALLDNENAEEVIDRRNQTLKDQDLGLSKFMFEFFVYNDRNETIVFHPKTKAIVRRVPNLSKKMRVIGLYGDYDGMSLFGRSLIDQAYDAQKTLDFLLQSFIYATEYNLDPTLLVRGTALDEDNFTLKSGQSIIIGDENGEVKPIEINTDAIRNFPSTYSLIKSTLTASLPNSNETGISAEIGNPSYSRTQAGVNDQQRKEAVENNYIRKNFEAFFELFLENALAIYISEIKDAMEKAMAKPLITLPKSYAEKIRQIAPNFISKDNQVLLDMGDIERLDISVDFESTRALAREEDLQRLDSTIKMLGEVGKSNPTFGQAMSSVIPLLVKGIVKNSNIENGDEIVEKLTAELEKANNQIALQSQQGGINESL